MPDAIEDPEEKEKPTFPPAIPLDGEFEVIRQKVWLEINPLSVARSVTGKTDITLLPLHQEARALSLNCRQARITKVSSSLGRAPTITLNKPAYRRANLPGYGQTAEQHTQLLMRLNDQFQPAPLPELHIHLGDGKWKYPVLGVDASEAEHGVSEVAISEITITIEFEIEHVRDGLQFVGCDPQDMRYPHVYTQAFAGSPTSCLFPCFDDTSVRCTWEIAIKTPKTVGDALGTSGRPQDAGLRFSEEDKARDLMVICSGELTDEIADKQDSSMKETSFRVDSSVLARHIGFAIGPFEEVNLSAFRESGEDDKLGKSAVQVHGFCLPGRSEEVRNTCFPVAKAIDFFVQIHQYPYKSYKIAFLDDTVEESSHCASLSLCSTRLLFPEEILEPMNRVTRTLAFCVASQWFGVNIIPSRPQDIWVVVGLAYFMADMFMKKLAGTNEYRYFQKRQADRVFESDVRRPSLMETGANLWIDPNQMEFLGLKGSMVMFILDRRLIKANGTLGLSRIIFKLCMNNTAGDLANGSLSTQIFMRMCEKFGHLKLDSFFEQWVIGAGCPHFQVTQRFNKKRLVVEMVIKQVQHEFADDSPLKADDFLRDAREELHEVFAGDMQPVFKGPMTIRIHEADGTPYEHIVEIKDMITRIEIPYNTKYKRLKRTRRNKEKLGQGSANADEDTQGGLYMLGDNLQSDEELRTWKLAEFTKEEDERMNSESFEWIRMDADFEWICRMQFNMPPHMYLSQLQQDRDVVAQLESITYFANSKENALVSTFLVRTLMDRRYFYGIRSAAATALSKHAKDEVNWIGLFHLKKAFQSLFCLPNGMIKPNDFSDRALHYIQCAIVRSMGMIRDNSGRAPYEVRRFLYETLRYNDNSTNDFSDAHFAQAVMRALGSAVASAPPLETDVMDTDLENADDIAFFNGALEQIDRHRRLDEWLPSYHNILTIEGLNSKAELMRADRIARDPREFLRYTQVASHGDVRIAAFDHLLDLGFASEPGILTYFLYNVGFDTSPYVRKNLMQLFGRWLGMIATGQLKEAQSQTAIDGLVFEGDDGIAHEADEARKKSVSSALAALKTDLGSNETLSPGLWSTVSSSTISLFELWVWLDVCYWLFEDVRRCLISLRLPRYWQVVSDGLKTRANGSPSLVMKFTKTDRVRTKRVQQWHGQTADNMAVAPKPGAKRKSSTFQPSDSMQAPKGKLQKRNSLANGHMSSPSAVEDRPKSLKLKLKMPGAASPPPAVQTPGAQTPGGTIRLKIKPPSSHAAR